MIICTVRYVRDPAPNESDSSSSHGAGNHPALRIRQVKLAHNCDSPDTGAIEQVLKTNLRIVAIDHIKLYSCIPNVIDLSAQIFSAPQQNLDGRAALQFFHVVPVRIISRGKSGPSSRTSSGTTIGAVSVRRILAPWTCQ
jgi:hypothetical protein